MTNSLRRVFIRNFAVGTAAAAAYPLSVLAAPPPEGSKQALLMKKYAEFIKSAWSSAGGWCCDESDGRGGLKAEGPRADGSYLVLATREAFGEDYYNVIPPEGLKVEVPKEKVLTGVQVQVACKKIRDAGNKCEVPDFSILWLNHDGSSYCFFPKPDLT